MIGLHFGPVSPLFFGLVSAHRVKIESSLHLLLTFFILALLGLGSSLGITNGHCTLNEQIAIVDADVPQTFDMMLVFFVMFPLLVRLHSRSLLWKILKIHK